MAPASLARPSIGDPVSNPPAQPPNINFRRPSYKDSYNQLLILPALDNGGIHYETAHIACAILANNCWDGWFTEEQGGDRVYVPDDGILRKQNYYFRVSDHANGKHQGPLQHACNRIATASAHMRTESERYLVVPNFSHWRHELVLLACWVGILWGGPHALIRSLTTRCWRRWRRWPNSQAPLPVWAQIPK
jgi:hypothetical protein